MKKASAFLLVAAFGLAGCSAGSGLLNGKETVPSAANVPVGNTLVMPPDLSLSPPGATSDAYQPNGNVAAIKPAPVPAAPASLGNKQLASNANTGLYGGAPAAPAAAAPASDIFAQYGISRTNPDGSKKTQQQLNEELMAAIRKKKQQTNPGYGTVANIGAIFKDQ